MTKKWKDKNSPMRHFYLPLIVVPLALFLVLTILIFIIVNRQLMKTGNLSAEKFYVQSQAALNEMKIVSDNLLENRTFVSLVTSDRLTGEDDKEISSLLYGQVSKMPYVNEAIVICPDLEKTYTSKASYKYDSFRVIFSQQGVSHASNTPKDLEGYDLEPGFDVADGTSAVPFYVSKVTGEENHDKATIIVTLNKTMYLRSLVANTVDFCCVYNDEFMLSSEMMLKPDADYKSEEGVSSIIGEPAAIFTTEDENYTYLVGLSKNSFYRPLYITLLAMGIYFLTVLIFAVIHTIRVRKQETEFLNGLIEGLPHPNEKAEEKSVLASVEAAIENYKQEHLDYSRQLRFKNLRSLIKGNFNPQFEKEFIDSLGLDADAGKFFVLDINVTDTGIVNPAMSHDFACIIINAAINNMLEGRAAAVVFTNDAAYGAIITSRDENMTADEILSAVKKAAEITMNDYGCDFRCSISEPVDSLINIPEAFRQAQTTSEFIHAVGSRTRIATAAQLKNQPEVLLKGEFLKQVQTLLNTLLMHKYDLAAAMVDTILNDNIASIGKDYEMASARMKTIATVLCEVPAPQKMDMAALDAYKRKITDENTVAGLSEAAHEYLDVLDSYLENDSVVSKACEFIENQLSNVSLSVPDVAEAANVSVQYLSRLFRQEIHMTVVEYIHKHRIDKAKELLASTNKTIIEIAESTGYCNVVTFSRNFKKNVDCTPSEYRQKAGRSVPTPY